MGLLGQHRRWFLPECDTDDYYPALPKVQKFLARRGELLNQFADLMFKNKNELAQIESLYSGKVILLSHGQFGTASIHGNRCWLSVPVNRLLEATTLPRQCIYGVVAAPPKPLTRSLQGK